MVGLSDLTTDQGLASPARACGLQAGDVITHINGTQVSSIEAVQAMLQELQGQAMTLTITRNDVSQEVTAHAAQSSDDGQYKLGAWIRDSMAGIGTLTFADPETGLFGTLGHGINDVDTAVLMKLQSGAITPASVAGVVKGMNAGPGEPWGLLLQPDPGDPVRQHPERRLWVPPGPGGRHRHPCAGGPGGGSPHWPGHHPLQRLRHPGGGVHRGDPQGLRRQPGHPGPDAPGHRSPAAGTDRGHRPGDVRLPILQDGKLVGAVTHVLVDHADRGYGILAQNMLDQAQQAQTT